MNFLKFRRLDGPSALLICFYAVILISAGYRIAYIFEFNPIDNIWSDPQRHWEQGTDVLRQDPMVMTDPILYQIYIAVLAKLSLQNPFLIAFYTSLLSVLTPWLWYRFFRELQASKIVAVAGWAGISLIPSWIGIYGYLMQETLMLPLLGASLWATWRCRRKQTISSFTVMIALWIAAGLTRGICIPMAAVAATWLWLEQPDKIRKAACSVLVFAVTLGPLTYRSYEFMGIFAPHGVGHLNAIYSQSGAKEIKFSYEREGARWFYGFMSPALLEKPLAPLSSWETRRQGSHTVFVNLDEGSDSWDRALDTATLSPRKYLWITGENLVFLLFSSSWPDSNRERWLGDINYQTRWLWAPLLLLCAAWTGYALRRQPRQWLLPSLILTWFVVQGLLPISVNEGRYRKPLEGLLVAQIVLLAGNRRRPATAPHQSSAAAPSAVPSTQPKAAGPQEVET